MSKSKKPNPDRHKAKRRHYALPPEWGDVIDLLASRVPQQATWYLIKLVEKDAKEAGVKTPPAPWVKPPPPDKK